MNVVLKLINVFKYYEKVKKKREKILYQIQYILISFYKEVKWLYLIYDFFFFFRVKEDFNLIYLYYNELS